MTIRNTKDNVDWQAQVTAGREHRQRRESRLSSGKGKTFETLTPAEKDKLLKELFIRFGLVEDSD